MVTVRRALTRFSVSSSRGSHCTPWGELGPVRRAVELGTPQEPSNRTLLDRNRLRSVTCKILQAHCFPDGFWLQVERTEFKEAKSPASCPVPVVILMRASRLSAALLTAEPTPEPSAVQCRRALTGGLPRSSAQRGRRWLFSATVAGAGLSRFAPASSRVSERQNFLCDWCGGRDKGGGRCLKGHAGVAALVLVVAADVGALVSVGGWRPCGRRPGFRTGGR